jgi:hypothetical protein
MLLVHFVGFGVLDTGDFFSPQNLFFIKKKIRFFFPCSKFSIFY